MPGFTGISTGPTRAWWRDFAAALRNVLCLTDSWIPAFISMIGC